MQLHTAAHGVVLSCANTIQLCKPHPSTRPCYEISEHQGAVISIMGSSSSKPGSPKTTIKEAIDSIRRQINYRPAEQDALSQDLDCLKKAQAQKFNTVTVDKKKVCSSSVQCTKHQYKT